MSTANPIFVEEARGHHRENFHRGAAVVVDAKGQVIHAWGDIERPIFGRSAVKMIQALPLLESGAAEKWALGDKELALACASHNGEEIHTNLVDQWLRRLGLTEKALECGILRPGNRSVAQKLLLEGKKPSPLHHACSGKHMGFLTTAVFFGEKTEGYVHPQHPAQKRVRQALEDMMDLSFESLPQATDGCSIPTFGIPLKRLALGMARIADPQGLSPKRQHSILRLREALQREPLYVHGTGAFDTRLIQTSKGQILSKMGAGGIQVAAVPEKGWGIALKIDDGSAKAGELAMVAILEALGLLEKDQMENKLPLLSHAGHTIGFLTPTRVFQSK